MNIELLSHKPNLCKAIKLIVTPLAALSMVSDLPGTYYKTQEIPDKYKICGLFENILGWHFDKKDRIEILKEIKKNYQKKFKEKGYDISASNSSYQPLLLDFFEIGMVYMSESINYNDLWKRSFSRMDADVHPNGTPNLDYKVLRQKGWVKEKELEQENIKKEIKNIKDSSGDESALNTLKEKLLPPSISPLLKFFQNNKKAYPMYYTSPTLREYTDYLGGEIQIGLKMDENLFKLMSVSLKECSSAYLGNSEGWVEIKLEEL